MTSRRDTSTKPEAEAELEPEPEPDRDGGPKEAAAFIAETLLNLTSICHRHRFDTLGYLLNMAHMEADGLVRAAPKSRS
jgi:hypothetical protein